MSLLNRFARRWAEFKTYGEWKDHAASASIGSLLAEQLDHHQAPNYLEMTFKCAKSGREFVVTVRRIEGQTPHQLRRNAEQTTVRLADALRDLIQAAEDNSGTDSIGVYQRQIGRSKALLAVLGRSE